MMPTMAWAKLGSLYEPTRKMTTKPATVNNTPMDCMVGEGGKEREGEGQRQRERERERDEGRET